jgi:hypothetical protein
VETGCIATETLVASAFAVHVAHRGAEYRFAIGVKARKDAASPRSNKGAQEWLRGYPRRPSEEDTNHAF